MDKKVSPPNLSDWPAICAGIRPVRKPARCAIDPACELLDQSPLKCATVFPMDAYKPVECGDYDILEIICMDAYDVEVITDTDTHSGVASNIEKQKDGEYLVLTTTGTAAASVRADKIVKINVLTRPCRFTTYDFR